MNVRKTETFLADLQQQYEWYVGHPCVKLNENETLKEPVHVKQDGNGAFAVLRDTKRSPSTMPTLAGFP